MMLNRRLSPGGRIRVSEFSPITCPPVCSPTNSPLSTQRLVVWPPTKLSPLQARVAVNFQSVLYLQNRVSAVRLPPYDIPWFGCACGYAAQQPSSPQGLEASPSTQYPSDMHPELGFKRIRHPTLIK
ncbi:uncharacterized protein H6S33_006919 [Morchella sextelata]|uniref:uncharacterized protein n=1 Tax=Morchella sextelata TaxID=1174677 RepID=UPI001D04AEC8|nr:uncharacterized protein H6S33_006919 [Morchella sextelata]KAH0604542.1 hypothetical protein H6S33_006919 [Morchella sextelata]